MQLDNFTCIRCKNTYDEFERNDRACRIDKQEICQACREKLGLLYPSRKSLRGQIVIFTQTGKTGKQQICELCQERIPKGSREVSYRLKRGKRIYQHLDCPEHKQGQIDLDGLRGGSQAPESFSSGYFSGGVSGSSLF